MLAGRRGFYLSNRYRLNLKRNAMLGFHRSPRARGAGGGRRAEMRDRSRAEGTAHRSGSRSGRSRASPQNLERRRRRANFAASQTRTGPVVSRPPRPTRDPLAPPAHAGPTPMPTCPAHTTNQQTRASSDCSVMACLSAVSSGRAQLPVGAHEADTPRRQRCEREVLVALAQVAACAALEREPGQLDRLASEHARAVARDRAARQVATRAAPRPSGHRALLPLVSALGHPTDELLWQHLHARRELIISGHQWSSVVSVCHQWSQCVISGLSVSSVVSVCHQWSSVCHQWSKCVISGHQCVISGHQWVISAPSSGSTSSKPPASSSSLAACTSFA